MADDRLLPEEELKIDEHLISPNQRFDVAMQSDGNLVVYDRNPHATWGSGTENNPGTTIKMQSDGNLVAYNNGNAIWASNTFVPGSVSKISNEGDFRVVSPDRVVIWSTIADKIGIIEPEPPIPPSNPVDDLVNGVGCSEYSLLCGVMDYSPFLEAIQQYRCKHMRITAYNAWSTGIEAPGVINGNIPFVRRPDGKFDLNDWNPNHFNRARAIVKESNHRGIFPVISILELYTWSESKQGTPPKNLQPFQNNVNSLFWSDKHDDSVWGIIAKNDWVWGYAVELVNALKDLKFGIETTNEMKEKPLHGRVYDAFRAAGFTGPIYFNHERDLPSMYPNMITGVENGIADTRPYAGVSWHGKSGLWYLDEQFEENSNRPTSYRAMWNHDYDGPFYDRKRMIFSSDGCRSYNQIETYNWEELVPVALQTINEGIAGYEHQSCTKMRLALEGQFDANDVHRYDSKLLIPAVEAWEKLQ